MYAPKWCGFVLLLLTDILEWQRVQNREVKVAEMVCNSCHNLCTTAHLFTCPTLHHLHTSTVSTLADTFAWSEWQDHRRLLHLLAHDIKSASPLPTIVDMFTRMGVLTSTDPQPIVTATCCGAIDDSKLKRCLVHYGVPRAEINNLIIAIRHTLLLRAHRAYISVAYTTPERQKHTPNT